MVLTVSNFMENSNGFNCIKLYGILMVLAVSNFMEIPMVLTVSDFMEIPFVLKGLTA